jgi:NitT/TauT family transport system substrate-binding protein
MSGTPQLAPGQPSGLGRRVTLGLALGALAAPALPRRAWAANLIRIMTVPGHSYMAPLFAQDTGLFAHQGLDVQVGLSTAPPSLLPAVASDSIQVGVSTGAQIALAREAGLDIVALSAASVQTQTHKTTALLVAPGSPLRTPRDFIGKKVASPGTNGTFYLMFLKWLIDAGIDPKSVIMLEAGFAQMGDMLRTGQVDGVLAAEPFLFRLVDSKAADPIDYYKVGRQAVFDSFYICSQSWASANHAALVGLRQGLRDAIAGMAADQPKAAEIEAKYTKLPLEVINRLGVAEASVDVTPADMQVWLEVGKQTGLLSQDIDPASLIAK